MSYYNTTNQFGEILKQSLNNAESQDRIILSYFKHHYREGGFGASDLFDTFKWPTNWPITSIRRSINTLLKRGEIIEIGQQPGLYGKPEFTYLIKK